MHAVQNSCKTLSHPAAGTPAQWVRGQATPALRSQTLEIRDLH